MKGVFRLGGRCEYPGYGGTNVLRQADSRKVQARHIREDAGLTQTGFEAGGSADSETFGKIMNRQAARSHRISAEAHTKPQCFVPSSRYSPVGARQKKAQAQSEQSKPGLSPKCDHTHDLKQF